MTPIALRSSRLSRVAGRPLIGEAKPAGAVVTVVLSSMVVVVVGVGVVVDVVEVVVGAIVVVVAMVVVVVTAASPLHAAANSAKAPMRRKIRDMGGRA